ncbi:MAG: hypothetical protein AAB561_02220 [Patescibacteria group bacterium]
MNAYAVTLISLAIIGVLLYTGLMNYLIKEFKMTVRVYWATSELKKSYEEWHKRHFHQIAKFKRGVRAWRYAHWPIFHRH